MKSNTRCLYAYKQTTSCNLDRVVMASGVQSGLLTPPACEEMASCVAAAAPDARSHLQTKGCLPSLTGEGGTQEKLMNIRWIFDEEGDGRQR